MENQQEESDHLPGDSLGPFLFYEKKDGIKLHYRTSGKSSAPHKIVFVMGLMGPHRSWFSQFDYFSQKGEEFECLFFDNRGIGFSDTPEEPYTTQEMGHDTFELTTEGLGWNRFSVCGISMGGMIAQHVALLSLSSPNVELTGLMLCSTLAKSSFWARMPSFSVLFNLARERLFVGAEDYRGQAELTIANTFSENFLKEGDFEKYVELIVKLKSQKPPRPLSFPNQFAAVRGHELTIEECQALKNAPFPVRAISGNADQLIPHQNTHAMKELLGAEVTIIEGAGHSIHIECEKILNTWISEFISPSPQKKN